VKVFWEFGLPRGGNGKESWENGPVKKTGNQTGPGSTKRSLRGIKCNSHVYRSRRLQKAERANERHSVEKKRVYSVTEGGKKG